MIFFQEISGTQLWRELKPFNQLGVTRGQMGKCRWFFAERRGN
jgi:hypothetical protein